MLYGPTFSAKREEPWSLVRTLLGESTALFPDSVEGLPSRISVGRKT
ncbi:MAG TPA: hypothetical protein VHJ78_13410 [Actinomycetota bacterium]|nr:hypothetical protein [Actinomycetota bacterium]